MIKLLLLIIIGIYQRLISPLFPSSCRFYPCCSEYCRQSLQLHGVIRGGGRAILRILKCHPFHPGGFDPVK